MTTVLATTYRAAARILTLCVSVACLAGVGCSSMANYSKQSASYYSAYREGNLTDAANTVTSLAADESGSGSAILHHMERGSVLRTAGYTADSTSSFSRAEAAIEDYDRRAKISARDVGSETAATITNDRVLPYTGYAYDRIMVSTYKALNFLRFGNHEAARVELRRAYERQRDAVRQYQEEIEATASAARSKGMDYSHIARDSKYAPRMGPGAPEPSRYAAYADFVNPFTTWLDGITFMYTSDDPGDRDRARQSLERVVGMIGQHPALMADLQALPGLPTEPIVYVVVENGMAPTRRENRFDLPVPVNNQIYYVGVALPELQFQPSALGSMAISGGGRSLGRTDRLCSMDAIVAREFQERYGMWVTRAMLGAAIRLGSQIAVGEVVRREKGDEAALLASAAMSLVSFAVTRADLRTWQTLPKEWQFARVPRPADGRLHLSGGPLQIDVTLPDAHATLVYIRTAPPGLLRVETMTLR